MHQYARYYEKWRGLRASVKPTEAVDSMTLDLFYKEIREEKGESLTPEEMETALREKLDAQTNTVYKKTQDGTNKRWVYEAEIKRSYFHVKPLDRPQLQNWSKYLDFEESLLDISRIRALYERCLVPCVNIYSDNSLSYNADILIII
jgi:pre-mRNA-processing factor 39